MKQTEDEKRAICLYHVPTGIHLESFCERRVDTPHGQYRLQQPQLTEERLKEICQQVLAQRENYLAQLSTDEIVRKIDAAVQLWLDPQYELRQIAEQVLPVITGYNPEMIRLELKKLMRTFRKKELLRFLDEEFDQAGVLDGFRPRKSGGMSRAFGPHLIFHIFSGNVPGLPIWSLIMGLLLKSANVGKSSSSEPLMAALFCQTLAEVDTMLANALAVLPWKGGTLEFEDAVMDQAEAVIVYGSNETVERVRERARSHTQVLSYGHKVSFAMIGREALSTDRFYDTVHRFAEDVSVYDQQSCLSPQSVFVEEGGALSAQQFAQMLGAELQRYQEKRPRAKLTDAESLAIRTVRNQYEFASMNDQQVAVYASKTGTEWTVIYHAQPGFEASPLNRTVHVYACQTVEEGIQHVKRYREYLQSAGLAVGPERLLQIAARLGEAGVNRITAIGQMTRAQAGWHHDGRFNLLDLVRWTDIEGSAENLAELYDPDVE